MSADNDKSILDTCASVIGISELLCQEQDWNGKTVLRIKAHCSIVTSDTEMKYEAPKMEMFAVLSFKEENKANLGSEYFK